MARGYLGLVVLALVVGCATRASTDANATAQPAAAAPTDAPERDDGLVTVSGRLRAHDGSAVRMGEVRVNRYGYEKPAALVELDAAGRFSVELPPGAYQVSIAAVDHGNEQIGTVIAGDLEVVGMLGTYARPDPGETIRIRAELLDAERNVIGNGPREAKRVGEGVYRIELGERPPKAVRLRYQLAGKNGRTYNGPTADLYKSDGGGDYWSVVELGEKRAIDLDLGALPPAGREPRLEWKGESDTARLLRTSVVRWQQEVRALLEKVPKTDGKIAAMTDAHRAEVAALASAASAEVDAIDDPRTQVLLRAAHMAHFAPWLAEPDAAKPAGAEHLPWILDNVPPDDPHLVLVMNLDHLMFRALKTADAELTTRVEAWLERRASNPEPGAAIDALQFLIHQADQRRDDARVRELYARAQDARFAGMYARRFIAEQFDPDRLLQRGKTLPAFDFVALESDRRITSSELEGKLYLLEFWATWCGPCVVEMPKLHDVYAAVNGARPSKPAKDGSLRKLAAAKKPRVEFVFVSFDADRKDVAAFRREHWSMPWTHAFVGNAGSDVELMKRFGFSGVPTAILVDERGTILEVGGALRGDQLQATLERVLAERARRSN